MACCIKCILPKGMMKPGMMCPRIYQIRQTHLGNSSQSLKVRMCYQIKNESIGNSNKSVNWIIEDFESCS